jgi:hypothetical protein
MSRVKIKPKWLRLSEETNALDYLEQAYYYIRQVNANVVAWKWVILALHGALYGFAVCACRGTNPNNVTFKTKKSKVKLISFDEVLKRCQDPNRMSMPGTGKCLQLTDRQKESIRRLRKQFRNNFEHYIPMGWSIELHGMPGIAIDVLKVIRFLALEASIHVYLNQTQQKKVKSIVFQCRRILKQCQLFKEAELLEKKVAHN